MYNHLTGISIGPTPYLHVIHAHFVCVMSFNIAKTLGEICHIEQCLRLLRILDREETKID